MTFHLPYNQTQKLMKTFLFFTALFFVIQVQSQTLKPFRVELGLAWNSSTDPEFTNGSGAYIEPRYAPNSEWLFGFRLERSYLNGGEIEVQGSSFDLSTTHIAGNTLFAEYFFSDDKVKPFVGVGVGVYSRRKVGLAVDIGGVNIGDLDERASNFGFAPRVGVNAGRWRFLALYNVTGSDIADYLSLNVGFEIGKKVKNTD